MIAGPPSAAERVLARTFGGPVRLAPATPLTPFGNLARAGVLDGPVGAPEAVIIKSPVGQGAASWDPDIWADAAPAWRVFNDWAGLAFLARPAPDAPLAPDLYGGDRATGTLVMEDLGSGWNLHELLLDDDPLAAAEVLVERAARLGRMQGRSAGREGDYDRLRDALGPRDRAHDFYGGPYTTIAVALRSAVAALGVTPAPGCAADLAALIAALSGPGPFRAYCPGDPSEHNWLLADGSLRAVDFEWGGFRHALLEGSAMRLLSPMSRTVGTVPAPLLAAIETAYRRELARGCPAAADETAFRRALLEGGAAWAFARDDWGDGGILDADVSGGLATMRQRRIHGFATVAALAASCGYLEALGETAGRLAAALRRRWNLPDDALPAYPAFASPEKRDAEE